MKSLKKPTEDLIARGKDVNRKLREQANKLRSKWRKVVTGDEKKRIRDHIRETEEHPKYIKLFDKIQFTLGVLNICACQFFLLNRPEFFWLWYAGVVPVMMFSRFYHFRCLGFQYFLIDFCYFTVFLTLANLFIFQQSALFFKVCFIFANGPLPVAILIWRNSFIFHDFDKIVSVYVHFLPSMLYYTLRWHTVWQKDVDSDTFGQPTVACYMAVCEPLTWYDYGVALSIYLFWQVLYILKTECWDKQRLDSHPELITSLRWMSSDTKNALAVAILKSLRKVRIFDKQEQFNATSFKTKMVFVVSQLLYTSISLIPTYLFYHSSLCHLMWIAFIFITSIYNGASFYIEVFSKRYNQKIAKIEEMHKYAKEAEGVMKEIAAIKKSNSQILKFDEVEPVKKIGDGQNKPASNGVTVDEKNGAAPAGDAVGGSSADKNSPPLSKLPSHTSTDSLDSISRGLQQTSEEAWAAIRKNADDLHYLMSGGDHGGGGGEKSYNYAGYPLAGRSVSLDSGVYSEEGDMMVRDSFDSIASATAVDAVDSTDAVVDDGALAGAPNAGVPAAPMGSPDGRGGCGLIRRGSSAEEDRDSLLRLRQEVWSMSDDAGDEFVTTINSRTGAVNGAAATAGEGVTKGIAVLEEEEEGGSSRKRGLSEPIPIDD